MPSSSGREQRLISYVVWRAPSCRPQPLPDRSDTPTILFAEILGSSLPYRNHFTSSFPLACSCPLPYGLGSFIGCHTCVHIFTCTPAPRYRTACSFPRPPHPPVTFACPPHVCCPSHRLTPRRTQVYFRVSFFCLPHCRQWNTLLLPSAWTPLAHAPSPRPLSIPSRYSPPSCPRFRPCRLMSASLSSPSLPTPKVHVCTSPYHPFTLRPLSHRSTLCLAVQLYLIGYVPANPRAYLPRTPSSPEKTSEKRELVYVRHARFPNPRALPYPIGPAHPWQCRYWKILKKTTVLPHFVSTVMCVCHSPPCPIAARVPADVALRVSYADVREPRKNQRCSRCRM